MEKPTTIDEYIAAFPEETRKALEQVREVIRSAAPDAGEKISYAMPAFTYRNSYLVYFAAFKNHIGFYPAPVGVDAFKEALSAYKTGKGSVQFPLDRPMPLGLIARIVKFRMAENLKKAKKNL